MRYSFAAVALCVSWPVSGAVYAAASNVAPAPPPPPAASSPASSDSDAAAKHAKLTACLKEAKARKLIGAEKSAFIKDCTSKP